FRSISIITLLLNFLIPLLSFLRHLYQVLQRFTVFFFLLFCVFFPPPLCFFSPFRCVLTYLVNTMKCAIINKNTHKPRKMWQGSYVMFRKNNKEQFRLTQSEIKKSNELSMAKMNEG